MSQTVTDNRLTGCLRKERQEAGVLLSQCQVLNYFLNMCSFDLWSCRGRPSFAHLPREPEDCREAPVSRSRVSRVWSHQVQRPNWYVCVCVSVCAFACISTQFQIEDLHLPLCICCTSFPSKTSSEETQRFDFSTSVFFSRGRVSLYIPEPTPESMDSSSANETSLSCQRPRPCQLGLAGSWSCQSR